MGIDIKATKDLLGNFIEDLKVSVESDSIIVEGILYFASHYDEEGSAFFCFSKSKKAETYIEDKYKFKLTFNNNFNPSLTELEGKIESRNKDVSLIDLHFPKNIACLGSPHKFYYYRPKNLNAQRIFEFIQGYIIPYFYAQTYHYKFKHKWPWPNLEHGVTGLLEEFSKDSNDMLYLDISLRLNKSKYYFPAKEGRVMQSIKSKLRNEIKGHRKCICRSGRKFRNCHPLALKGLQSFREYDPKVKKLKNNFTNMLKG